MMMTLKTPHNSRAYVPGTNLKYIADLADLGLLSGVTDINGFSRFYYQHILPNVDALGPEEAALRLRSYMPACTIMAQLKDLPYATEQLACVKALADFARLSTDRALTFIKTLSASDLAIPALTIRICHWIRRAHTHD